MAVRFDGKVEYEGCVFKTYTHYWLDGMLEETAVAWDVEEHEERHIQFGYYGIDGSNLAGGTASIDISSETARDMLRTYKRRFLEEYEGMVAADKKRIEAGRKAVVVRGQKVKKGTVLDIFWVGERETYRSRQYSWMHETEKIAGGFDEAGNKVWVKLEYLENITEFKSPTAKERKERMKRYVSDRAEQVVLKAARRRATK